MLTEMPLRSVRDRVLLLRSLGSFAALDDDALTMMAERARSHRFHAGQTVLVEGQPVTRVYIVVDGRITSSRRGKRIAVVGRSSGVGMLSVMARDPEGVQAVADVDTLTLELPAELLDGAMEENFSLLRNSLRLSAREVVRKRGKLPARNENAPPPELGTWRERPTTLVERLIDLSSFGIFATCNVDAVIAVARSLQEVRAEAGHVLWKIGDPSSHWLRIEYGHVRCTSDADASVDVGSRFVLGIMDALGEVARSYEARAMTPVIAYRTDLETFLPVLETHFALARHFMSVTAKAILEMPSIAQPAA